MLLERSLRQILGGHTNIKIAPEWSQGGPKMEAEFIKDCVKIEKNALNHPKWLPDGSEDPFTQNSS